MVNCTLAENFSAVGKGGGIDLSDPNSTLNAELHNCLIVRNRTTAHGGGGLIGGGTLTVVNSTIAENTNDQNPAQAGLVIGGGALTVVNSILWENAEAAIFHGGGTVTVTYSNVHDGWTGTGNIDIVPLFSTPANGDCRIHRISPCRNFGSDNDVPADVADVDDNGDTNEALPWDARKAARRHGTVDMGAYEVTPCEAADLDGDGDVDQGDLEAISKLGHLLTL